MLILTRKLGESIIIADNIVLSVLELENGQTTIGIDSPEECKVVETEMEKRRTNAARGDAVPA